MNVGVRVMTNTYTHWNPHTYAQPICGPLQISHTNTHPQTSIHAHTHPLRFPRPKLSPRNATDADELQASLLGDDHSLSRSSSTPLVLDTQTRLTHHFLHLPFHQSLLLCRHRCPRSYTLWVGADGSYSSPSIRALWGEQGDHNTPDSPCVCVSLYIYIYSIYILCAGFYIVCLRVSVLPGDTDDDGWCSVIVRLMC